MSDKVYFATNRVPRPMDMPKNFGTTFHPDSPMCIRFGYCTVTGKKVTVKAAKEVVKLTATEKHVDLEKSTLGSKTIFETMRTEMAEKDADTLIFVHGYNVDFKEAIQAAAKLGKALREDYGLDMRMAVFSWPSNGQALPWDYVSDRRDGEASGPALARTLLKFTDFLREVHRTRPCNHKVHLMAHSMGNFVLRHALSEYLSHAPGGRPVRLFEEVLSMAADEDNDAFERDDKLRRLPDMAQRVHIYHNRYDRALQGSDWTKGNPDRLGNTGPREPIGHDIRVSAIDVTSAIDETIAIDSLVGHGYYNTNRHVLADVAQVLRGVPTDSIEGRTPRREVNRYVLDS